MSVIGRLDGEAGIVSWFDGFQLLKIGCEFIFSKGLEKCFSGGTIQKSDAINKLPLGHRDGSPMTSRREVFVRRNVGH